MQSQLKQWDRVKEIQVIDFLEDYYGLHLTDEHFKLEGYDGEDDVRLNLGVDRDDGTYSYQIEVRVGYDENGIKNREEGRDLSLDVLGWVLEKFFRDERHWWIPLDWTEVQFAGKIAYLKGEKRHLEAERMADELLKKHGY